MTFHIDTNIGQVGDEIQVERLEHGSIAVWRAYTTITHILGGEVQGPTLEGFGPTPELALAALDKELRDFNDSLWDS